MRLDIRYVTRFDYRAPVRESQNELRACPASGDGQQLVNYRVVTTPSSRVSSTLDYWGTRVDQFGIRAPHSSLEIVAEAAVETTPRPPPTGSPRMDRLADPAFRELHEEYLAPSPHTAWNDELTREARRHAEAAGDDAVGVVQALHRSVGSTLEYVPGTTYVGVPVEEVLACKQGVCQDFAHLAIALCRSMGIPARYVSGYLFTSDDATGTDVADDVVHVQTHAWFEAAIPGVGWVALDPTNQQEVGERHVKIGHGRDYDDVPPLKGVFSGPPEHRLDVRVEMRRMSAQQVQQQQQ